MEIKKQSKFNYFLNKTKIRDKEKMGKCPFFVLKDISIKYLISIRHC